MSGTGKPAVVMDCGTGYTKMGFAGNVQVGLQLNGSFTKALMLPSSVHRVFLCSLASSYPQPLQVTGDPQDHAIKSNSLTWTVSLVCAIRIALPKHLQLFEHFFGAYEMQQLTYDRHQHAAPSVQAAQSCHSHHHKR